MLFSLDFVDPWFSITGAITHLLLQLLAGLQTLVSSQQSQFVQLAALHSPGQEEVQREGHVLGVPAAGHVHVVLRLHPESVDLQQTESTRGCSSSCLMAQQEFMVSHQSRFELLLHQRDEGQAVRSLFGRQIVVRIELLKNRSHVPEQMTNHSKLCRRHGDPPTKLHIQKQLPLQPKVQDHVTWWLVS